MLTFSISEGITVLREKELLHITTLKNLDGKKEKDTLLEFCRSITCAPGVNPSTATTHSPEDIALLNVLEGALEQLYPRDARSFFYVRLAFKAFLWDGETAEIPGKLHRGGSLNRS